MCLLYLDIVSGDITGAYFAKLSLRRLFLGINCYKMHNFKNMSEKDCSTVFHKGIEGSVCVNSKSFNSKILRLVGTVPY